MPSSKAGKQSISAPSPDPTFFPITDPPTDETPEVLVTVTSELMFFNLIIQEKKIEKDTFISTFEDSISNVITDNLGPDQGTTISKIASIDGNTIMQKLSFLRLLNTATTTTTIITFEIKQIIHFNTNVEIDEDKLQKKILLR